MKLIITRHGETVENVKGIFQGHLHGQLTKKGIKQAEKLAERLRDEKIDIILSSDLKRASDTAREVTKHHLNIPIYFLKELRERNMGCAEGKSKEELGWNKVEDRTKIMDRMNAEPIPKFTLRAKKFNENLLEKLLGKNVLLVGHRGINLAIIADILNQEWVKFCNKNPQKNTSLTIFKFNKNKEPELKLMNCVKHLGDSK
ncbi:MAG: histidine phosphatase family protein [Nanoarchaeota archaeon]